MNQFFNFDRWVLFTGKHWNENKKKYLLGLCSIGALLTIWYLLLILMNQPHSMRQDTQVITYFVGLFLIGCLYASMWFTELSDGPKGVHALLVPASIAEKLLTAILYAVVLFFICYTIIFYVADVIMVYVQNRIDRGRVDSHGNPYVEKVANVFRGPDNASNPELLFYLFMIYVSVQAAFLLGSIYFSKYSFIKTAIALLVIFLFFIFYLAKVMDSMMPAGHFSEDILSYSVLQNDQEKVVRLSAWIGNTVFFLLKYAFAPIFWVATFFRLKEKEV